MLDDTGLEIRDLEFIAVGLGPGSFTGLRIGLAAVKGLAWAGGVPLVGVPTLGRHGASHNPGPPRGLPGDRCQEGPALRGYVPEPSTLGGWDRKSDYSSFTLTGPWGGGQGKNNIYRTGFKQMGRKTGRPAG